MPNAASFAAAPAKRVWAWCFDLVSVLMLFWFVVTMADGLDVDLGDRVSLAFLFFAYHFAALALREGRTLGKAAVEIMVVSESGRQGLSAARAMVRAGYRSIPLIIAALPVPLADFAGSVALLAIVVVELRLLERSPARQTVADRLAQSLVVNSPPLEPHRAPAGPLYSARDAEFSPPPRQAPPKAEDWHKRSGSSARSSGDGRRCRDDTTGRCGGRLSSIRWLPPFGISAALRE